MRRTVTAALGAIALVVALAGPASAHSAPPCNDTDGDGAPSGAEYHPVTGPASPSRSWPTISHRTRASPRLPDRVDTARRRDPA